MHRYSPEQWGEASRLYCQELKTLREVADATGIRYDRLAQKAAAQGWYQDQELERARREDAKRQEGRAAGQLMDALLSEEDPKTRTQLVYAYERLRRMQVGAELPRGRKREVVQDFLVELFSWMREEAPEAIQALAPAQERLKGWIEERYP